MTSKRSFFIILLITVFLSFCKEQKDTIVIPVLNTEYSIILDDSIKSGLNIVKVDSKSENFSFLILSNADTVHFSQNEKLIPFPYSTEDDYTFFINDLEVYLPISEKIDHSIRNTSHWIVLLEPKKPVYGIQSISFTVFKKENGKWLNSSESVYFQPWMNMKNGYGHSSQFNEQVQLSDSLGLSIQKGKVAFSMPGEWDLRFIINSDTLTKSIKVLPKD